MLPSTSMLLAICAFSPTLAIPNYSCKIYLATTPISTRNVHLSITPPANQSAMTAFITSYTSQTSRYFRTSDTNGSSQSIDVNGRYQIYTQLCTPSTFENGTDVEFVVHGCVIAGVMVCQWSKKAKKLINHFPGSGLITHIGTLAEMGLRITMLNQR